MNDTSEQMEKRYHALLMRRSGARRLAMGCAMFDAAREIVKSSILNENPGLTDNELKEKIFVRFYGLDFSEPRRKKILAGLKGSMNDA
jgi:hypothetical protein